MFVDSPENLPLMLSAVLKIPVESIKNIKYKNSEILPETISNKFCRLDLNVEVDGKTIDIEIQVDDEGNYRDRAVYYWSLLCSNSLNVGSKYGELKPTILISFVDFKLFPYEKYHSKFLFKEDETGEVLSDKACLHFVELPKVKKADKSDLLSMWAKLIDAETEEDLEEIEKLEVAEMTNAVITIKQMNEDEKSREIARLREKARRDESNALNVAEERGEKNGLIKTAKALLLEGLPIPTIIKCTGLSSADIEQLGLT